MLMHAVVFILSLKYLYGLKKRACDLEVNAVRYHVIIKIHPSSYKVLAFPLLFSDIHH